MHSNRMRTGRSLTVLRSLLLGVVSAPGGVCFQGGVYSQGMSAPGGMSAPTEVSAWGGGGHPSMH